MGDDQNEDGKLSPRHQPMISMANQAVCEVCGQNQEKCFVVYLGGERHVFDSFECAIHGLLPTCSQCGRIIFDSGVWIGGMLYCQFPCASL